jgi:hypothetical protein
MTDEPEYEVEAILDDRTRNREYFVKWAGLPDSENSWEPSAYLASASHLVEAYWVQKAAQGGKKPPPSPASEPEAESVPNVPKRDVNVTSEPPAIEPKTTIGMRLDVARRASLAILTEDGRTMELTRDEFRALSLEKYVELLESRAVAAQSGQ